MENKKHSIKDDFTMLALLIIPVGVAINFVGAQIASVLKLPIYMDSIGTIFSAMLCGPWVGAVAGGLTNVVTGITMPVNFAFMPVNIVIGLLTGFLSRKNMFSIWWKSIVSVIIIAFVTIAVSSPIVVLVYGGVTGSTTSIITATAMAAGANIWAAVIGTEGVFTLIDKIVAYVISLLVIKVIPPRTLVKFGCGEHFIKRK